MTWIVQSWSYINGHAIRHGIDLMALEPHELFDYIEVELEDYMMANAQSEKGDVLDLMRNAVMRLYSSDYKYVKFKELYGTRDARRSNVMVDDGIQADDPLGRSGGVIRPYLDDTEQTDAGFAGLDAPLA